MRPLFKISSLGLLIPERLRTFPEKLKGGRIEKWAIYWRGIYADYREVGRETVAEARNRPLKASLIGTGLGLLLVAFNSNPDEHVFRHQLQTNANRLALVSNNLRNPVSEQYINTLLRLHNEGLLRVLNLGFFSLLWNDNYDRALSLYSAQCIYLKPRYLTFHKRIVDFGAFGKWYLVDLKMRDYDVNFNEWN